MRPAVWPMREKRASRRLSASNEFTGKRLVAAAAGMRHMILAAAQGSAHPRIERDQRSAARARR